MKHLYLGLCLFLSASAVANMLLQAEQAIQEGASLKDYAHLQPHPLYPYLQAAHWQQHLNDDSAALRDFLKQNHHLGFSQPLALSAFRTWRQQQPQRIVQTYESAWDSPEINCLYQEARQKTGRALLPDLTMSAQCLSLFSLDALRQYINQALQAQKKKRAEEALAYLPAEEALAVRQWLDGEPITHPRWRSMERAYQIHRLSPKKLEEALILAREEALQDDEDYRYAFNRLLLHLARQDHPATYEMWAKMPAGTHSEATILDVIAYALRRHDWDILPQVLSHLSQEASASAEIQYWLGRAKEKQGKSKEAITHYRQAAKQRDYFGFLAADILKQAPAFNHREIKPNEALQAHLMDGLLRVQILRNLGEHQRAQKELSALCKQRSPQEIEQIALLLSQMDYSFQAITLLAQHQLWDGLTIRFPIRYRAQIERLAAKHQLKPSQILAIIRKESIFQEQVKSSAGAIGLMQVLPRTASETAKRNGLPYAGKHQLTQADINLAIGTQYLSDRLHQFGDLAYAAAAYNAGPQRVKQWLSAYPNRPIDEWIALIPFTETRDYVKKVLEYEKIYEYLWSRP